MVTPKVNETKRGSAHKPPAPAPRRPPSRAALARSRRTGRSERDARCTLNSWALLPTIGAGRCTPRPDIPHPSTRGCRTPSGASASCRCSIAPCGASASSPATPSPTPTSSSPRSRPIPGSPPTSCASPTPPRARAPSAPRPSARPSPSSAASASGASPSRPPSAASSSSRRAPAAPRAGCCTCTPARWPPSPAPWPSAPAPTPRPRTSPACSTTSASSSCRSPSARRSSTRSPASTPIGAGRALLERERFGVDHAHAGEVFAREAFLEARVFNAIGAHHGDGVPSPEAACVQAANAAVHLLHDLHADADVLDAALAELSLDPAVLDEVVPAALPSLAPTVSGLAGRIAALERAATTDDVTGLLTRAAWMTAVREQLQGGRRASSSWPTIEGLAALDERHGYASGNLVLCELARILGRRGTAGRLGGDALALWAARSRRRGRRAGRRRAQRRPHPLQRRRRDRRRGARQRARAPRRRRRRGAARRRRGLEQARDRWPARPARPRSARRSRTGSRCGACAGRRAGRGCPSASLPCSRRRTALGSASRSGSPSPRGPGGGGAGGSSSSPGHQPRQSGRLSSSRSSAQTRAAMPITCTSTREREGQHLLRHAPKPTPPVTLPRLGAKRAQCAPSSSRSRASESTASAAWRPESRLPPPERSSACSIVSTVSTPNAHGTPVVSWTSWMPRAASAQTQS